MAAADAAVGLGGSTLGWWVRCDALGTEGWTEEGDGRGKHGNGWTNHGPMWGNSDLQWLLAAQQLPSGWVASSVPRQTTPAHGRAQLPMQEVSRSLTLPRGKFWSWEGCRPCSKQGIISKGRGQLPGACGGWCNAEQERNKREEGGKKRQNEWRGK